MVSAVAAVVLEEADSVPMFIEDEVPNVPAASDSCAVNTLVDPKVPVMENGIETVLPEQTAEVDNAPTVIV
jgi:hypothetical protein